MARIVRPSERKEEISYQLVYDHAFSGGSYWFPCDAEGKLLPYPLASFAKNMERIQANPGMFAAPRVEKNVNRWTEPAVLACDCDREVVLEGDARCECGQWYNVLGQKLRPPEQWGEETGETLADILVGGTE